MAIHYNNNRKKKVTWLKKGGRMKEDGAGSNTDPNKGAQLNGIV